MNTTKWTIDPTQSETAFKVKKLIITTVHGSFKVFEGQLETESEEFETIKNIQFKATVESIKTDDEKRDDHLRSADFFDMDTYPYFSFSAKNFNSKDSKIQGEIKIRDITKPVTFDVEFLGTSVNENGETKAGLAVSGKVDRNDFGLTWSGKNEAGDIIVGDEIKLSAQLQFTKTAN